MRPLPISMRPFGGVDDLDIEFGDGDRPALVTALLDHCAHAGDPSYWWARPVGARIEAMLRLLALTDNLSSLDLQLRCTGAGCGELYEVALPLDALQDRNTGTMTIALGGDRVVHMRRPTGDDLRQWRAARHATRAAAMAAVIGTLCLDGTVTPDDEAALGEALAMHDPLVAFSVSCTCPACGTDADVPIDLESTVLHRLATRQGRLLREVHLLASHYGWTEAETLAVPAPRRARYLALIEEAS